MVSDEAGNCRHHLAKRATDMEHQDTLYSIAEITVALVWMLIVGSHNFILLIIDNLPTTPTEQGD